MIPPSLCPICSSPLSNSFLPHITGNESLEKHCIQINHNITLTSFSYDHNKISSIFLSSHLLYPISYLKIYPETEIRIRISSKNVSLPYFDANLSSLPALKEKLTSYLLFL